MSTRSWFFSTTLTTLFTLGIMDSPKVEAKTIRTIKCGEKGWKDFNNAIRNYCKTHSTIVEPNGDCKSITTPLNTCYDYPAPDSGATKPSRIQVEFTIQDSGALTIYLALTYYNINFEFKQGTWYVKTIEYIPN